MIKNEIRLNNLSAEKKMTPQEMKNLKGGSSGEVCCERNEYYGEIFCRIQNHCMEEKNCDGYCDLWY